jgi:hypothetical protein
MSASYFSGCCCFTRCRCWALWPLSQSPMLTLVVAGARLNQAYAHGLVCPTVLLVAGVWVPRVWCPLKTWGPPSPCGRGRSSRGRQCPPRGTRPPSTGPPTRAVMVRDCLPLPFPLPLPPPAHPPALPPGCQPPSQHACATCLGCSALASTAPLPLRAPPSSVPPPSSPPPCCSCPPHSPKHRHLQHPGGPQFPPRVFLSVPAPPSSTADVHLEEGGLSVPRWAWAVCWGACGGACRGLFRNSLVPCGALFA